MQPKIEFRRPYFVTPHAVERFRERVLAPLGRDAPDMLIIQIIQAALQVKRDPAWAYRQRDGQICKVYGALYAGVRYYIPTVKEDRGHGKNWDAVPTILGPEMGQKKEEPDYERNQA